MDRCCFCGKKIGAFSAAEKVPGLVDSEELMCSDCHTRYLALVKKQGSSSAIPAAKRFFSDVANNNEYPDEIRNTARQWVDAAEKEIEKSTQTKDFPLTTSPAFDNYTITDYIGIVSGESFLGTGIFSDVASALSDTFGTESENLRDKMKKARAYATQRMVSDAYDLGANAIVGVHYEYFSMASNMLAVSVSGTAVVRKQQEVQN